MNFNNNNDDLTQTNLNNNNDEYSFALCNLCFWCATIFFKLEKRDNNDNNGILPYTCPLCFNSDISLIPLARRMPMKYQIAAKMT
jgi:hypothetical protein